MNKYRNKKSTLDNITFHSRKERRRYAELLILERVGEIKDLELQPKFEILPTVRYRGETMRRRFYIADFRYKETTTGELVVEDVKSKPTREEATFRLKRQMFLHLYGAGCKFIET